MSTDPRTTPWIKASASDTGSSCVEQRRHDAFEFIGRTALDKRELLHEESESLVVGQDFGIVTDIKTGPNGNLFVVSLSNGAVYEISNYIVGVEQLATTTLRNLVGGMSLEETLTSRDQINNQLRGVLDEATGFLVPPSDHEALGSAMLRLGALPEAQRRSLPAVAARHNGVDAAVAHVDALVHHLGAPSR